MVALRCRRALREGEQQLQFVSLMAESAGAKAHSGSDLQEEPFREGQEESLLDRKGCPWKILRV